MLSFLHGSGFWGSSLYIDDIAEYSESNDRNKTTFTMKKIIIKTK